MTPQDEFGLLTVVAAQLGCTRPLVALDVEATGPEPTIDRIVELAVVKVTPDGPAWKTSVYEQRFKPDFPIPEEATEVHGISDLDVLACPLFRDRAAGIRRGLEGCDILGYNVARFDLTILDAEFCRAGLEPLVWGAVLDPQMIYHKLEPRNLTAAVNYYCNLDHESAHNALGDVRATVLVLHEQLNRYGALPMTVPELAAFCAREPRPGAADVEGKFVWRGEHLFLAFGRYKGQEAQSVDPGFYRWMLQQDFEDDAKAIAKALLDGRGVGRPVKGDR
jgi:DNA polymerase-3 subunit epsilon